MLYKVYLYTYIYKIYIKRNISYNIYIPYLPEAGLFGPKSPTEEPFHNTSRLK